MRETYDRHILSKEKILSTKVFQSRIKSDTDTTNQRINKYTLMLSNWSTYGINTKSGTELKYIQK